MSNLEKYFQAKNDLMKMAGKQTDRFKVRLGLGEIEGRDRDRVKEKSVITKLGGLDLSPSCLD
jgi:hypothetical protein